MNWKGMLIGGATGAAFGWFFKCTGGTCPITSNWWLPVIIGAVFGLMWTSAPAKKDNDEAVAPEEKGSGGVS